MERDKSGNRTEHTVFEPEQYADIVINGRNKIPDLKRIFIAGGEPTLNKDFLKITKKISPEIDFIDVVTNGGRFFEKKFAYSFSASGGHAVHMSVHSHLAKIHDGLTGRLNSHKRCIVAGNNVLEAGLKLYTNTVLNAKNYEMLPETVDWLIKTFKDLHMIVFYLVRPVGAADGNSKILAPLSNIAESVRRVIEKLLDSDIKTGLSVRDIPPCLIGDYSDIVKYQDFFVFENGEFRQLSDNRYKKKFKCIFCGMKKYCRGFLSSYPEDKVLK
ncbi:radical SAM protein [bacterium]|nr:radical SAM protein [bacterium]